MFTVFMGKIMNRVEAIFSLIYFLRIFLAAATFRYGVPKLSCRWGSMISKMSENKI